MESTRPRRLFLLLLAGAGTLLVLLLALELILRAVGYSSPQWYRPDPVLGWALRPGFSAWFTSEGRSFMAVNSAGQRDHERALEKPDDVYRIAVLGDAYSEGAQVALRDTYWAQLPARLADCGFQPGKRIEVLNFGVRGYGTAQAYLVLEKTALRYRPDLVLLQFTNGNDVRDNSRTLDQKKNRPFFSVDASGALRLDDSFTSSGAYVGRTSFSREVLRELADHFRMLQLARDLRELPLLRSAHAQTGNEAGLETAVLAAPRDARWAEAWRITEALIARMGELASRNGAKLAVVPVPYAAQVHPDRALREALQAKYGVPDLAYPDRRVAAFAERNALLAVMLAPEMQARAVATGSHLYGFENRTLGFGHWNELGHRTASEVIARRLCAARL